LAGRGDPVCGARLVDFPPLVRRTLSGSPRPRIPTCAPPTRQGPRAAVSATGSVRSSRSGRPGPPAGLSRAGRGSRAGRARAASRGAAL